MIKRKMLDKLILASKDKFHECEMYSRSETSKHDAFVASLQVIINVGLMNKVLSFDEVTR